MAECLSHILSPLGTDCFLEHYRTRQHFHLNRNDADYYSDLLSVAAVDLILQSEQLPAAFLNVVTAGARCPLEEWSRVDTSVRGSNRVVIPERLFELYAEGATLILNQAERSVPSLSSACRRLTDELGFPAQANVYITPRAAAGLARHADDHEVLVIQIAGSKRWRLYPLGAPAVGIDLRAGGFLYLPRGLAHSACSEDDDSIHVTLGLRPAYAFQLIEELASLAADHFDFQQPMPPRFAADDARKSFEGACLERLQLLICAQAHGLLERRFDSLVATQARGWPDRLSDLRVLHKITPQTVVRKRPGIVTCVKQDGIYLRLQFAGKDVRMPAFLTAAYTKITGDGAFAVDDIEGFIGTPGKVKLVAEFVRAGLLQIVAV